MTVSFDDHRNFAVSTVAVAPDPPDSGTSLTLSAGDGLVFPTPPFNMTVWQKDQAPTALNAEIVRGTAIDTDTLTIERAQEGTTARTIIQGDSVLAGITVKTFADLEEFLTEGDFTGPPGPPGGPGPQGAQGPQGVPPTPYSQGVALPQEPALNFVGGLTVTDDPVDGQTVVSVPRILFGSGSVSFPNNINATVVTITHNLGQTGYVVMITPTVQPPGPVTLNVQNKTANTFDVDGIIGTKATITVTFDWLLRGP